MPLPLPAGPPLRMLLPPHALAQSVLVLSRKTLSGFPKDREGIMNRQLRWIGEVLLIVLLAACAAAPSMGPGGPGTTRQTGIGEVFTDANGMTLYTYDEDTPGKSNCTGLCAAFWPPVIADGAAKPTAGFAAISRADGSKQWAYKGNPLYGYALDAKAGDTAGDGADGVWHAAKP